MTASALHKSVHFNNNDSIIGNNFNNTGNDNIHLVFIQSIHFQVTPGKASPIRKLCKLLRNLAGWMHFLLPDQNHRNTERVNNNIINDNDDADDNFAFNPWDLHN